MSILAGLFPVDKDPQRVTKYKQYEHIFDKALEGIEFLISIQWKEVYQLNHHNNQYKIYSSSGITKDEKKPHWFIIFKI